MATSAAKSKPAARNKKSAPDAQLAGLIDKYTPEIAEQARALLHKMRGYLPGATELVYDNYNALAIGFGPDAKTSDAIFSLTLYPRWISLFFLQGARLSDPHKLLKGSGTTVRHIVLDEPGMLDTAPVLDLMRRALESAAVPIDPAQPHRLIIKSISIQQRPRRPAWVP